MALVLAAAPLQQSAAKDALSNLVPVTEEVLRHPPADDWLTYRANFSSWGFSELATINTRNVGTLTLAWVATMESGPNEATPLVRNGVMFLPHPGDVIEALGGTYGTRLWMYRRSMPSDVQDVLVTIHNKIKRNIAIYGDRIYTVSADQHLVAIDARSGDLVWETPIGDYRAMMSSSGPIVAGGKVISGRSCSPTYPGGCFITAHDASSGKELWRTHLIPRPGEPGDETWMGLPLERRVHVGAWGTASYDPSLGLLYIGTSVPAPSAEVIRGTVGGDVLYSNSTLALDINTGRIAWYFQHLPRDNWDMDHTFERILVDLPMRPDRDALWSVNPDMKVGAVRSVVTGIPGKTGIVWTLDRRTGEFLWARPTVKQNFITAIDAHTGRPTINESLVLKSTADRYPEICPSAAGGKDWPVAAYSPRTHAMYQPLWNSCGTVSLSTTSPKPADVYGLEFGFTPANRAATGWLEAISAETGKTLWRHEQAGRVFSALATAGDLVFAGDSAGRFMAFDAREGNVLWAVQLHAPVTGTPIAYAVNGTEYIAIPVGGGDGLSGRANKSGSVANRGQGNLLYVFRLPQPAERSMPPVPMEEPHAAVKFSQGLRVDTTAGEAAFAKQCSGCHGVEMTGSGHAPALTGCSFVERWRRQTVGELFRKIMTTMPPGAAALDEQTVANIVGYWARSNRAPEALTSDPKAWAETRIENVGGLCRQAR